MLFKNKETKENKNSQPFDEKSIKNQCLRREQLWRQLEIQSKVRPTKVHSISDGCTNYSCFESPQVAISL